MVRPLPPSNNSNNKILSANHRPSASLLRGRFLEGVDKTTDNSSTSSSRQPWRRRHSRSGSISENWGDNDYEAPLKRPVSVDLEELDVREQDIKQRHQQQSLNDCNEPTTTNNNKALRGKGILRFLGGKSRHRNNDNSHSSDNGNKQYDADTADNTGLGARPTWQAMPRKYSPVDDDGNISNQLSEDSNVSEMTNSTIFVAAKTKHQTSLGAFDPDTFADADPFASTLPMVGSDEFSDPFFPPVLNESTPSLACEETAYYTVDNMQVQSKMMHRQVSVSTTQAVKPNKTMGKLLISKPHHYGASSPMSSVIKPRQNAIPLLASQKSISTQNAVSLDSSELFSSQHSVSSQQTMVSKYVRGKVTEKMRKRQQQRNLEQKKDMVSTDRHDSVGHMLQESPRRLNLESSVRQVSLATSSLSTDSALPSSKMNKFTDAEKFQTRMRKLRGNTPQTYLASKRLGVVSTSSTGGSVESAALQLSSTGSDINRPLSMVQTTHSRPLTGRDLSRDDSNSMYGSCDESRIKDPLQRAGLRLLINQAVIPIQRATRRHLALREAMTRMWAIVAIQSMVRRFLVQQEYLCQLDSSIIIQAWWRGCSARDDILLKQCCAIEIQRFVRGYQATLSVYGDIFRVTVVQSIARRKRAIEEAMDRMIFVVQTQAIARGFLVRFRLRQMQSAAQHIQSQFRAHVSRKNLAILKAVIKIQSVWRGYICSRTFLEYFAAIVIQAQFRRYLCYVHCKQYMAARYIQAQTRGYTVRLAYKEYVAARMIQAQWRMYTCSKSYLEYIAAMIIQTQWRAYIASQTYKRERAVVKIQSNWRAFLCSRDYLRCIAATMIQALVRGHLSRGVSRYPIHQKLNAAIKIQRSWRGFIVYSDYLFTLTDVIVCQSVVRRMIATRNYKKMRVISKNHASRVIQRFSRGVLMKKVRAAVRIQSIWRGFIGQAQYLIVVYENAAATTIQSAWRRFWCNSNFLIGVHSAVIIQSFYRGQMETRKNAIQKQLIHLITEGAASVGFLERTSTISIQKVFRGYMERNALDKYLAARDIQTAWRCFIARVYYLDYRIKSSALRIQCFWRRSRARTLFLELRQVLMFDDIMAAILVQKVWRGISSRSKTGKFDAWQRKMFVEDPAAVSIQKIWRGFNEKFNFWYACGSAIQIQRAIRGWVVRRQRAKENDAVVVLQCIVRRWQARMRLAEGLGAVIFLQGIARGMLARKEAKERRFILQFIRTASGAPRSRTPVKTRLPPSHAPERTPSRNSRHRNSSSPFDLRERSSIADTTKLDRRLTIPRPITPLQVKRVVQERATKEKDDAARRIQRFFLMVKKEVDREIRRAREKKGRKKRKPLTTYKLNDDENRVLEDVWTKTVADKKNLESESNHDIEKSAARDLMVRLARPMQERKDAGPLRISTSIAREMDLRRSSTTRLGTASIPVAPSRLATLSQLEMDLDLVLEQAWMDTEIRQAKERRQQQQVERSKKSHRSERLSSRKFLSSAFP